MGRVRSKRSAILGVGSLLGFAALGFSLSAGAALGRDRLDDLPRLPPPLCRTHAWVESRATGAKDLGAELAAGAAGEVIEPIRSSLAAGGWDSVPSLILAWRRLDLEDESEARTGAALAEFFNTWGLESTLDWQADSPRANRDGVADLHGAYLEARVRLWPKLDDGASPILLEARVWTDDLLREGASRSEVRDARGGIVDHGWLAVPAVLGGIQSVDLEDPENAKKIQSLLRLMKRFPGAPTEDWSGGTSIDDRLGNLALLEGYMAAALAAPILECPVLPRPETVSKRDWVDWERGVTEFISATGDTTLAKALVAAGPELRPAILNAMRTLNVLAGEDYAVGSALDGILREIFPDTSVLPWAGTDGVHPAIAARDAIVAWQGGSARQQDPGATGASVEGKFGGRAGGRRKLASQGGEPIAAAIGDGLLWLASNQRENGSWSAYPWSKEDGTPIGEYEVGLTGLALLAFLADGQTANGSLFEETTRRGIRWLLSSQNPETGAYGPQRNFLWIYDHAIATQAIAEFAAQTEDTESFDSLTRAVALLEAQRTDSGSWGYEKPTGVGDTSVTAWVVSALAAARTAGVAINPESLDLARGWFERITDPVYGRAGYLEAGTGSARILDVNEHFPSEHTEALSAAALWGTLLCADVPEKTPHLEGYARLLAASPPSWKKDHIDFYYWYWGALGAWQMGGESPWAIWDESLRRAMLPNQRQDGKFKGSWDPVGPWCHFGRRVYSTAMGVLILETYYRYENMFR